VACGVAVASAAGASFAWGSLALATASTLLFALRSVLAKRLLAPPRGQQQREAAAHRQLDAGNTFALLTTLSFLWTLPAALYLEGPRLEATWAAALAGGRLSAQELLMRLLGSAVAYYLYNEVAFYTLAMVHPVAHAVGNTAKRALLLLGSALCLGTPMGASSALGCAVALSGALAFVVARARHRAPRRKAD
jgi:solute carrier family 35 protein E1